MRGLFGRSRSHWSSRRGISEGSDVAVKRAVVSVLVAALLIVPQVPAAAAAPQPAKVNVLTRNLYLGADLAPVFQAPASQFLEVAKQQFLMVQATDFPSRAKALAHEIKDADPVLIGLQEASLWRKGEAGVLDGPVTPATIVVYDYLQLLRDALAAEGLSYNVLVEQFTSDGEIPTALGYDVRLTQRTAILGKAGLPPDELAVSNAASGLYATFLTVPTAGGPALDKRGWTAVDATVNQWKFRFITTHLDSTVATIRTAQAAELLAGPASTSLPVVLAGDLNAPPTETAYLNLVGAGFADTWTKVNGTQPGWTCCNAENLLNPTPTLTQRIDHVLAKGSVAVNRSKLVGTDGDNRTSSGLWPSDHAGVNATLANATVAP
jgi:hypothetical protein